MSNIFMVVCAFYDLFKQILFNPNKKTPHFPVFSSKSCNSLLFTVFNLPDFCVWDEVAVYFFLYG